jgi:hypothetical protein
MTRWAIGLSAWLVLGTAVAQAAPASERCDCGTDEIVLPQPGAMGVPRNTKVWAVGRNYGEDEDLRTAEGTTITARAREVGGRMRVVTRYDVPDLGPMREYVAEPDSRGPTTRFTTGPDFDLVAPAAPVIRSAGIAITPARDAEHGDLGELQLDAGFDADTALVKIEISGTRSQIMILTVPGDWRWVGKPACERQLNVRPGDHVQIAVTAIDLAGNESAASVQQVVVAPGSSSLEACARWHHRVCGAAGATFLVLTLGSIVSVAILMFVIVIVATRYAARWRALQSAAAEALSSLAGERLVRGTQVRAALAAVLGIAGVSAFAVPLDRHPMLLIISTIMACVGVRGFLIARAMLAMIESGRAEVVSLAHRVIVRVGEAERSVDLDETRIAEARRRYTVPTTIARAK